MPSQKRKPTQPSRPPTPDDEWLAYVADAVAKEIIGWLKGTVNVNRSICSLSPAEVTALAGAAVARYEVERSRREEVQRPGPSVEETTLKILL